MIELKNVSKFYYQNGMIATGFTKINLKLKIGEFVVITGESGSGKSTLLNVISGLDSYEEGEMYIDGAETSHYGEKEFEEYRRKYIGNIFQNFNLINSYTVYQNIELVLLLDGKKKSEIKNYILDIIDRVGLSKFKNTKVSKLSGGQKQRVAIARVLAHETPIIVADEPTGNLDSKSSKKILELLHEISKDKLVIVVTHNKEEIIDYASRVISMHDGRIIEDKKLHDFKEVKAQERDYKNITLLNKLRLGFRNTFNIIPKFLLMFVVFFLVSFVFLYEYSGFKKTADDISRRGYNMFFQNNDQRRIVINHKDKTPLDEEKLDELKSIDHVAIVFKNDALLDRYFQLKDTVGFRYLTVFLNSIEYIDKVDYGRMPNDSSEAVLGTSALLGYMKGKESEFLDHEYEFTDNQGYNNKIKIVGIKNEENAEDTIYLKDEFFKEYPSNSTQMYSKTALIFNDYVSKKDKYMLNVMVSKNVAKGEVYIDDDLAYNCSNNKCNDTLTIYVDNVYYNTSKLFKITKTYTLKNFKNILGYTGTYESIAGTFFINEEDYKELYKDSCYQASIFVDDYKNVDKVNTSLRNLGYNTLAIKDTLYDETRAEAIIMEIVSSIVTVFLVITLFFIAYFVIKLILKSRNIYFTTIRILGSTKKIASQILSIELFVNASLAYIVSILLVYLQYKGVVDLNLDNIVNYMSLKLYIIIYLIMILISQLISKRFARKIFSKSIMKNYREEV